MVFELYVMDQIQEESFRRITSSNSQTMGNLRTESGLSRNSGSPDKGNLRGDGGFVLANTSNSGQLVKGSRYYSSKAAKPQGLVK